MDYEKHVVKLLKNHIYPTYQLSPSWATRKPRPGTGCASAL